MQNILVFKTNIHSIEDLFTVGQIMTEIGIKDWNVDRQDIDCVLRIVEPDCSCQELIDVVTEAGFYCQELE